MSVARTANGVRIMITLTIVEIRAVLAAARPLLGERASLRARRGSIARAERAVRDFCRCFNDADTLYITEVYAAGEEAKLARASLRTQGCAPRRVVRTLKESLLDEAREGDYILFLGAGSITHGRKNLLKERVMSSIENEKPNDRSARQQASMTPSVASVRGRLLHDGTQLDFAKAERVSERAKCCQASCSVALSSRRHYGRLARAACG